MDKKQRVDVDQDDRASSDAGSPNQKPQDEPEGGQHDAKLAGDASEAEEKPKKPPSPAAKIAILAAISVVAIAEERTRYPCKA